MCHLAGAVPDEVGLKALAGRRGIQRVHLDAARVDEQVIRSLPRRSRIEAQTDPIIIEGVVTLTECRADPVGLVVETVKREIEITIVVRDPHLSRRPVLFAAKGVVGHPLFQHQRRAFPDSVAEIAVNLGRHPGA